MIFIAVDINISDLDVLMPDVIGYVLIYMALRRLDAGDASFRRAGVFAVAGAIVSVPAMLPMTPIQPFVLLQTVFDLLMIWGICSGIIHMAGMRNNRGLANAAHNRRRLYLIAAVMNLAATPLALIAPELLRIVVVPLVAFSLVVALLVMLLMWKASVEAA